MRNQLDTAVDTYLEVVSTVTTLKTRCENILEKIRSDNLRLEGLLLIAKGLNDRGKQ